MGQIKMEWERMDGAEQYNALLDAARRVPSWCQSRKDSDGKPAPVSFGEWMRDGSESWEDSCHIVAAAGWSVMPRYIDKAEAEGKPLRFALYRAVMAAAQRQHYFLHPGRRTRHGEPVSLNGLVEAGFEPSVTENDFGTVELLADVKRACRRESDSRLLASRLHGLSYAELETRSGIKAVTLRQRVSRLHRACALAD